MLMFWLLINISTGERFPDISSLSPSLFLALLLSMCLRPLGRPNLLFCSTIMSHVALQRLWDYTSSRWDRKSLLLCVLRKFQNSVCGLAMWRSINSDVIFSPTKNDNWNCLSISILRSNHLEPSYFCICLISSLISILPKSSVWRGKR